MSNDYTKMLWEMAVDSPALQEALIKSMSKDIGRYSIPTRHWEIEHPDDRLPTGHTIHWAVTQMEDDTQMEKVAKAIKETESITIGQLSRIATWASIAIMAKEAEGAELSPEERTLKDIDITALALFLLRLAPKKIGSTPLPPDELREWFTKKREAHQE